MIRQLSAMMLIITSILSLDTLAYNSKHLFVEVKINSLDELITLFKKHHYIRND